MRLNQRCLVTLLIQAVAGGCLLYAAYIALRYASQVPLDAYSFRQSQTALTAYWLMRDGFSLAYETPVGGVPWSIPFEFPLYQYLAAVIAHISGFSLDAAGRLLSFAFLLLCLPPVKSITQRLKLPDSVFYIFAAMLLSSPVYVYWGRTFMIETAAVFFSVAALKYFVDILIDGFSYRAFWPYLVFAVLALLQKLTTGLPVLVILSFIFLAIEVRKSGSLRAFVASRRLLAGAAYFGIPVVLGASWTFYTDHVKADNELGRRLISSELSRWNWGTMEQRLSAVLYKDVLWSRMFAENLAGILGMALLLLALFSRGQDRRKLLVVVSLALGILPFFLFTNLHIVHTYYQSANLVFLIYAVAIALGGIVGPALGPKVLVPSLALILFSNYTTWAAGYLPQAKAVFTKENSRDFAVGEILKRELPPEKQFVAFGNDWSSTFAYVAQRKSFTVPGWFKSYGEAAAHPEKFVEKGQLGAVVSCGVDKPSIGGLIDWSSGNGAWKIGEVKGCYIATSEKRLQPAAALQAACGGSIDLAAIELRDGLRVISFAGWATMSGAGNAIPDQVYLSLSKPGAETIYLNALKVPRPDVDAHLHISGENDAGFSRIIPASLPAGEYVVGVVQAKGERVELCQFNKKLVVDGNVRDAK